MHSNSGMVGKQLYSPQEMQQLHPGDEEAWRRIDSADGEPVLEIYRQFQPMFAAGMHRMRHMQQYAATPQAIFIAFDASNIVSAEDREQRNTLIILFARRRSCWQAYCHSSGIAAICARASFYKMK